MTIPDAYSAAENYDRAGNWSGWAHYRGESIGLAVREPKKVHVWLARDTSVETTIHLRKGIGPVRFGDKVHEWVEKHAMTEPGQPGSLGGLSPLEDDL